MLGKNLAPLDKRLKEVKWGKYKLDDLFDVLSYKKRFDANKVSLVERGFPYIVRQSTNNGVKGFICEDEKYLNDGNTISFGQDTATMFYQKSPYFTGDKIKILKPKDRSFNRSNALFFITLMCRAFSSFTWGNQSFSVETIKSQIIYLPISDDGEIDFEFMESFVRELEKLHLNKLDAYLYTTGLNDYHLTSEDRLTIKRFDDYHWKDFRIGDLFEKITTTKLSYKAKDLPQQPTENNTLPCLTSSFMNQGLNYYAPREGATILNNVISIPSNSDVYRAYYQSRDFTVLSDAYAIRWKDDSIKIQSKQYLFLVACINQVTDLPIYSYKNKLGGWNVVKDKYITLPVTADEQPDLFAMEQLVGAIQKIVISDVVKYTAERLDATRQIITSDQLSEMELVELRPSRQHFSELELEPLMAAEPFARYKWEGFDQSIIDFFGGNQTILVGCYKDKNYHDWIHSHSIYNIRLGKTKGSMEGNRELFDSTSLLVLYELGKLDKLSAYKITGHHEISRDELIKMDYPNKKPRKSYMAFDIVPLEKDLTFLVEHHLIERLIEIDSNNAKGTPIFIEP